MGWTDDFQPVSEIAGNIEITFNSKNKDFDPYEPAKDQLVLTIGKTGRANRLTFEELEAEEVLQAAEHLKEIGQELEDLEEEIQELENEEFDINDIESGVSSEARNRIETIKQVLPGPGDDNDIIEASTAIEKATEEAEDLDEEKAEEIIENLKRDGELFEPKEDYLQRI